MSDSLAAFEIGRSSLRSLTSDSLLDPSDPFRRDENRDDEEESLLWAALERLPTYDRMRKGILRNSLDGGKVVASQVDVRHLGMEVRKILMDNILNIVQVDNERFLLRLRARLDRVGLELPQIEVRYENLSVEGETYVGSRALPTLLNATLNTIEDLIGFVRLSKSNKKPVQMLNGVSGILKPSRFLHPITYGHYPKSMQDIVKERLPKFTPEEIKLVKGSIDFVGINQYTAYYVFDPHQIQVAPTSYRLDWNAGFAYARNGVPIGPQAYSIWIYIVPWGMYKAVTYVKENYGNPTIILSENGMDDPGNVTLQVGLHDTTRVNYYKSYITELKRAIDDGANVVGYFGIVYVDYKNQKRYPKMSAYWFKQMLQRKKNKGEEEEEQRRVETLVLLVRCFTSSE